MPLDYKESIPKEKDRSLTRGRELVPYPDAIFPIIRKNLSGSSKESIVR
jgi:hypothetical protein